MQDHDQKSVGTWLCRLGGADVGVLELAPKARREYIALALVLIATSSIAVLSMTFAMTDGLKVHPAVAVCIGLFWGVVILTIDRALIINFKPKGGKWRMLLVILPRVALAALLGAVISTPLTLRVFSNEITEQMGHDQIDAANAAATDLAKGGFQQQLDEKESEIKKYNDILAGIFVYGAPSLAQAQKEYDAAKAAYDAKQQEAETAYRKWQCELYGVGCEATSGSRGNGPLAKALETEYRNRKAEATQAKSVMDTKQDLLLAAQSQTKTDSEAALAAAKADASKQLAILTPQRDQLRDQLKILSDRVQGKRQDGMLAQLVALDHLGEQNGMARLAHVLLFLLLFMIELLPVAIKTLSAIGPTTIYERADKFDDERILKLAAAKASRNHLKQEQIDRRAIESEVRVAEKVQAKVEEVVTEVAMMEVDRWGKKVQKSTNAYAQEPQGQQGTHNGGVWYPPTAPQQRGPYNLPGSGKPRQDGNGRPTTSSANYPHSQGGGLQP